MAEDDKYVTYERGRTGGTVRGPASKMVSGAHGSYKGEGGDAITQRPRARVGTAIKQRAGQAKPEVIQKAAGKRLGIAGAKASGKVNIGRTGIGIERKGVGRGFPPGKNKRVY